MKKFILAVIITAAAIYDNAAQHFTDSFSELLQLAIDNDARDPDQLQAIVDLFV